MDAAIYLRISDDRTGQQLGVARQREDCEKLCADKGWRPVEYLDNDVSASTGRKRPAYDAMLADIRAGRIGAVVCWDLDRLHRRPIELESFMALADEKQISLASVSGDVDLSTAQGRLIARLKGSVAAHETEHKKARQRRAAKQKAERGLPQWKYAFGYVDGQPDPKTGLVKKEPDPKIARLVTKVYRLILSGGSLRDGCQILNDAEAYREWVRRPKVCGCETPCTCERGTVIEYREWTEPSLSAFLRKPRNAALREHNGEIVGTGTWEPLVDEDLWRSVQDVLSRHTEGRRAYRKHLLSGGVLGCGGCGHYLTAQQTIKKNRVQYQCKACFGVGIAGRHVEPWVLDLIGGRLARSDAADLLRSTEHDTAEAEAVRQKISTLTQRLDEIAAERGEGLLTGRQAQIASEVVQKKLDAIETARRDRDRVQKFDGIRLGTPEAVEDVRVLSPDRLRAVIGVLAEITVQPVGKHGGVRDRRTGGRVFDDRRIKVRWL